MDGHDPETGELPLPPTSIRAATAAAQARVQIDRDRNGYGAISLHIGVSKALEKIPVWITTDKAGAHKIKYATLKAILEVVRPPLAEQGIRIRQGADRSWGADEGGGVKGRLVPVYTDLIDMRSGEYERTQIEIPLSRLDPQSMGSAITYGRRYTLLAALGLATDEADDDGDRAMPRDITAKAKISSDCDALVAEINGQKTLDALTKWSMDPKNRKRLDQLSDVETDRVQTAYGNKREKLSSAE